MSGRRYHHIGIPTEERREGEDRPGEGLTVAFIVHDGAPIEFLQFDGPEHELWPGSRAC